MIAVALMLAGIALLGVVTATIAAWFVERVQASDVATTEASLHDVLKELREIRAQLDALTAAGAQVVASDSSKSGEVSRR